MTFVNIRKLLALALVIALTLLPMAAFAEATQATVTIGNFDITINDEEPIHIDAHLKTSIGVSDDAFRYENEVTADGRPVARLEAAMQDDTVLLTADGLSNVYGITLEEIAQLTQYASAEMPFDPQLLENFIVAYAQLLEKANTMEATKQHPMELFEKAGIEVESKPESAEVMGETLELTRYDFEIKSADIDKLMAASAEELPEIKAYMDAYLELMGAMASTEDAEFTIDKDHPFESMMTAAGGEFSMKCTIWTDETGDNMRMECDEIMVIEDGGEAVTVDFPFTLMQKTDADGTVHMQMDMDMQPAPDASMGMHMLVNGSEEKGDMVFTMDVKDGSTEPTSVKYNMAYDKDAFDLALDMNVPEGGDVTSVLFSMNCKPSGDVSRVELSLAAGQGEQSVFSGSLGFDVKYEESALPEGPLMTVDKPIINISEMTEEDLAVLQNEGMTLGFTSLGALMADPGIAKIMTDITSAMEAEASDAQQAG